MKHWRIYKKEIIKELAEYFIDWDKYKSKLTGLTECWADWRNFWKISEWACRDYLPKMYNKRKKKKKVTLKQINKQTDTRIHRIQHWMHEINGTVASYSCYPIFIRVIARPGPGILWKTVDPVFYFCFFGGGWLDLEVRKTPYLWVWNWWSWWQKNV